MTNPIAKRFVRTIIAAAALSGAAACVSIEDNSTRYSVGGEGTTAAELLRPYYRDLAARTDFPTVPSVPVDSGQTLTRFVFGSCNQQNRPQDVWAPMLAENPQLALLIGDNVYADTGWRGQADLGTFVAAYRDQAAHSEFRSFMSAQPVLATWDDHDYGPNDGGGTFFGKEFTETLFENFWNSPDRVRARPGVYDSVTIGADGRRVQFIVLDTRFFRSDLVAFPYSEDRRPLGNWDTDASPQADMLGDDQWRWLERELAEPADLRVLVSSIQVLTEAHQYESWSRMPGERNRLLAMLEARTPSGLVMLSGDRHAAAFYRDNLPGGETLWEFTSSSLNLAFGGSDANEREPDPRRVGSIYPVENFGAVDIDWAGRRLTMRLLDDAGAELDRQVVAF